MYYLVFQFVGEIGVVEVERIYFNGQFGLVEMEFFQDLYEIFVDRLDVFVEYCFQFYGEWKEEVQDVWQRSEKFLRNYCFWDELFGD